MLVHDFNYVFVSPFLAVICDLLALYLTVVFRSGRYGDMKWAIQALLCRLLYRCCAAAWPRLTVTLTVVPPTGGSGDAAV